MQKAQAIQGKKWMQPCNVDQDRYGPGRAESSQEKRN